VPDGTVGEALIGGPDLYKGYLGRPEVTAEANRGGWYHSGDLVRRDERGLLYFVGRKKEIIRRSGENISSAEVEAVLRGHPKIVEVAVIPVADQLRGEEVKAFVQVKDGETMTPEEIVAYCGLKLAPFKIPRYIAFHQGDFERTPSMRVQKQPLRAIADQAKGAWDRDKGGWG
jgi:crotonobetaine/carnitine-CoA ligase